MVDCRKLRARLVKVFQVAGDENRRTVFRILAFICTISGEFGKTNPVALQSSWCQMVGQEVIKIWV